MADPHTMAGITRATPITEAAIITVDTPTDITTTHTVITTTITAPITRTPITGIPIETTIQL